MLTGSEADYATQKATHTGLVVYNVSYNPIPKCAPIPDGFYVWDGTTWQGINVTKIDPTSISLGGTDIYFPSGQDLRTMPTTPETFKASWTPANQPLVYTNTPNATLGGISFNGANTPPVNGNLTTYHIQPITQRYDCC